MPFFVFFVCFVVNRMGEAEQRAKVIAEAKTWLGTPFRNCADVKGAGVDCAMLLVRVFADTGIVPLFDPRPYPSQWYLHRDEERFLAVIGKLGSEVAREPLPGDVIVYRFGRCFAHGAVVIDAGHVLHAYSEVGEVSVSPLHEAMLSMLPDGRPRPRKIFDAWKK